MRRLWLGMLCLAAGPGGAAACSPSSDATQHGAGEPPAGGNGGAGGGQITVPGGGSGGMFLVVGDASVAAPQITPKSTSLTLDPGSGPLQTVQFEVTGAGTDRVVWRVTNPAVGSVDQQGLFTPSGAAAGETQVQAVIGDTVLAATLVIDIADRQIGGDVLVSGDAGAGGLGGVGGEGFGGPISNALVALLEGTPTADPSVTWLYPYDHTVFPLEVLPPLLQWGSGQNGNFEAVMVHLSDGSHYDYKGFFARPALLDPAADFVRHPIPPGVWETATHSAAGGTLTLEVVLLAGGTAYGPFTQTYPIALAPITGKIYYQAYNTALVQNYDAVAVTGARMGGATLSIDVGAESPALVAGTTTSDHSGCRVCHTVSAYGDRMLAQHGDDYAQTSSYDLKNGNAESAPYGPGILAWAGMYPDGSIALGNSQNVAGTSEVNGTTGLYDLNTGASLPAPGLLEFATSIGLPVFSPDGRTVAFTLFGGPSVPAVGTPDGRQLVAMDFDVATGTFSNPRKLWETTAADERPAWSTFLPSSAGLVFQRRWRGSTDEIFATRYGARGELWWVDVASGTAAPLDAANGASYVPRGPNNHDQDERLNFEPSISPVASGGYAWMVFLSRRMYGNVATIDPWASDPRDYDLDANVTPKKIWMAAIDLNPTPGTDPSHPAFYIPGQELHGVNSRPFFALEPCVSDAGTCSTGVDCCSGFCRDGYCVAPPPATECSAVGDKCASESDCCDSANQCIGGFCTVLLR